MLIQDEKRVRQTGEFQKLSPFLTLFTASVFQYIRVLTPVIIHNTVQIAVIIQYPDAQVFRAVCQMAVHGAVRRRSCKDKAFQRAAAVKGTALDRADCLRNCKGYKFRISPEGFLCKASYCLPPMRNRQNQFFLFLSGGRQAGDLVSVPVQFISKTVLIRIISLRLCEKARPVCPEAGSSGCPSALSRGSGPRRALQYIPSFPGCSYENWNHKTSPRQKGNHGDFPESEI